MDPHWFALRIGRTQIFSAAILLFSVSLLGKAQSTPSSSVDPQIRDASQFDPNRPLAHELGMGVADGFTFVAVGDCILSRPVSQYAQREADFAGILKILQGADATLGNLETTIVDLRGFHGYPYSGPDDVTLAAEPRVADDLAKMGFRLLSRANNHTLDWGIEGMHETSRWLDEAAIVHAGSGENRGLARAAQYFESSKGRVAIVSMASSFRPTTDALPPQGAAPGRPGISALKLKKSTVIPATVMARLSAIADELYPEKSKDVIKPASPASNAPETLTIFGNKFEVGQAYAYRYDMDPVDLAEVLKSIRQGKQHSDFLVVSIHSHEPAKSLTHDPINDFTDNPAPFLHFLARAAIDAGADEFVVTGIHHLGPIEIYKDRPIFYGLGDFFWSDIQEPLPADLYEQSQGLLAKAFEYPQKATDADLNNLLNAEAFAGELPFQSVITESRFDHGGLTELRLYPVELGYGMKLTESGIPRVASAKKGREILIHLREMSQSYGTEIQVESVSPSHYVGFVRRQRGSADK
jgi:poly-gamma-glutamate capsule biosynthesis protein CapA/YwtB (metallophosphatase superfamily)